MLAGPREVCDWLAKWLIMLEFMDFFGVPTSVLLSDVTGMCANYSFSTRIATYYTPNIK